MSRSLRLLADPLVETRWATHAPPAMASRLVASAGSPLVHNLDTPLLTASPQILIARR